MGRRRKRRRGQEEAGRRRRGRKLATPKTGPKQNMVMNSVHSVTGLTIIILFFSA